MSVLAQVKIACVIWVNKFPVTNPDIFLNIKNELGNSSSLISFQLPRLCLAFSYAELKINVVLKHTLAFIQRSKTV